MVTYRSDRARFRQHTDADRGALLACLRDSRARNCAALATPRATRPTAGDVAPGLCPAGRDLARYPVRRLMAARGGTSFRRSSIGAEFLRVTVQAVAFVLFAFGVLLRPNALAAAPLLAAYLVWPSQFSWKRSALLYIPAAVSLFGLVQFTYYGLFGAERQHPLHSIMVFDLGGISHFANENVFPGRWVKEEDALIRQGCYKPVAWDIYWTQEPCMFVMERLEGQKLFGTSCANASMVAGDHPTIQWRTCNTAQRFNGRFLPTRISPCGVGILKIRTRSCSPITRA